MLSTEPIDERRVARVLIVDDHPIVREGLALLLASEPDMVVCAQAPDSATALRLVEETQPDVVVVDISLQEGSGIDLIKRIKAHSPSTRMLVSSIYEESLYAERALRAGASGYINKQESTNRIVEAIRCVFSGEVFLNEKTSNQLLQRLVTGRENPAERPPMESLSDREMEVFELIGQGLNMKDIAARLHLSSKTVETYRDRMRAKLRLRKGLDLTHFAIRWLIETRAGSGAGEGRGVSTEDSEVPAAGEGESERG
jgi:DNA-binding NarL/FixJ family response regulator